MIQAGQEFRWERSFTDQDLEQFTQLSGDRGMHHIVPDEHGNKMIQGLLTATLPTKIGGDLNYVAREMVFDFHRPVYVGDTVTAVVTVKKVERRKADRLHVEILWECMNQDGRVVLSGSSHGVIFDP